MPGLRIRGWKGSVFGKDRRQSLRCVVEAAWESSEDSRRTPGARSMHPHGGGGRQRRTEIRRGRADPHCGALPVTWRPMSATSSGAVLDLPSLVEGVPGDAARGVADGPLAVGEVFARPALESESCARARRRGRGSCLMWSATVSPPTSVNVACGAAARAVRGQARDGQVAAARRAEKGHQGSISIESTTPWSSARFSAELPGCCLATTTRRLPATSTTYTQSVLPGGAQQSPSLKSGPGAGQ
jgi:hypothetical protein